MRVIVRELYIYIYSLCSSVDVKRSRYFVVCGTYAEWRCCWLKILLFIFRFLDLLEVHLLDGILVLFTLEISIPITLGIRTIDN